MDNGCTNADGKAANKYGHVRLPRDHGRERYAHRRAWVDVHGTIPLGLVVRHSCDNPACVNVEHLLLGTIADNQRDMAERGRGRNQFSGVKACAAGHPYTEASTYVTPDGKHRQCRICRASRKRRALARME